MRSRAYRMITIFAIIAAGILARVLFALVIKPISGDTAVFALMAKHILEFKEFPIYMPLAHYAGSLSCYAAAALFALFGVSYNTYIYIGIAYSSMSLILGCVLSRKILDDFGSGISCALIAIPSLWMLYWSMHTGSYAESFLLVPALLLLAIRINRSESGGSTAFMVLTGILSGLALWLTPNSTPAILTIVSLLITGIGSTRSRGAFMLLLLGILIGYGPAIIYNIQYPGATLFRMAGRVLDMDRSALSCTNLFALVIEKVLWRISTIPESLARVPRLIAGLISLPAAILFIISTAVSFAGSLRAYIKDRRINEIGVILIYAFWSVTFYVMLIGQDKDRFMMPICIVAPFLIGHAISKLRKPAEKYLSIIMIGCILIFNIGTCVSQPKVPRAGTYSGLTDWLLRTGALRGYSDYETAYIVQFESNEKVLISPTLFHPTFSDRYPEVTKKIRNTANAFYIVDSTTCPVTMEYFEKSLDKFTTTYTKDRVGDFTIYRGMPSELRPDDMLTVFPYPERS